MLTTPFRLTDRIVPGNANDPEQLSAFARALRDVGEDVADDRPTTVTKAARRFQASRGLAVDGVAGPVSIGSWTLSLLNDITAPILQHLVGPDSSRPVVQKVSASPPVVRNSPHSATTRAVPFRDEKQIAHASGQAHHTGDGCCYPWRNLTNQIGT